MRPLVAWVIVFALVAGGCTEAGVPNTETSTTSAPVSPESTTLPDSAGGLVIPTGLTLARFGRLEPVPLELSTTYPGPSFPSDLGGVAVPPALAGDVDQPRVRQALAENGFAIIEEQNPHFWTVYEGAAYAPAAIFVTTDVAYHSWHLVFDKILREAEQRVFLPALEELLSGLVDSARAQAADYAGTPLEDAADRAAQLYETAATVLGLDVGPIGELARQEVGLVTEASQLTSSPITSFEPCEKVQSPANCVDYSLDKPRGHYTRNPDLERYFRAMSVLGNSAFFMDARSLRVGLLASRALLSDPHLVDLWRSIYEPTAFLVGTADDYTPFEAAAAATDVRPDGLTAPLDFGADAAVEEVAQSLTSSRQVAIDPPSLRIMGVRFVLDSYVYDQLVAPNVAGRLNASPLDLAAAFGSTWARDVQNESGADRFPGYEEQLGRLRERIAARSVDDWGATVYDAWLYSLVPLLQPLEEGSVVRSDAYPAFMRNEAWTAKAHQTALGSYTELKHDTILYAKQAMAEGGGEPNPSRHWVEAEPVAFLRLAGVADLLRQGLVERDLFPTGTDEVTSEIYQGLLTDLRDWLRRLGGIAATELRGEPLTEDDNRFLTDAGAYLESFWIRSSDREYDPASGPDDMAALVADVMRSPGEVLELGTGWVDRLLVLVPDGSGAFQLATGAVYSYYEFWQPEGDRLTDTQWRQQLESGSQPARPSWAGRFLAGHD